MRGKVKAFATCGTRDDDDAPSRRNASRLPACHIRGFRYHGGMLRGSIPALITPMKQGVSPDTALDEESLSRLMEFHVEQGSDAVVVTGTTGEAATLSRDEHYALMSRAVEMAAGRLPVIAGTGANSTAEATDLTRGAKRAGADACLLIAPYYNRPTQEGLYLHYKHVAEAVDIPQLLYNIPGRTACDLLPETVARLAGLANIVGIKEASGDLGRVARLRKLCGEDFLLFDGDDASAMDFILRGGQGVISVTANVAPARMRKVCDCSLAGDRESAAAASAPLEDLHQALFVEPNPIPVKWALHRMGLIEAGIRLPMTWLSEKCRDTVAQAMRTAGVLQH